MLEVVMSAVLSGTSAALKVVLLAQLKATPHF